VTDVLIEAEWPTRILVERVEPFSAVDNEALADIACSGISTLIDGAKNLSARIEVLHLRPGDRETFTHGRTDWLAWMPLVNEGEGLTPDSGLLMLHDPRAAAPMVPIPGLPWGRPMTFSLVPGCGVIHPGWLGYSVLPLSGSHSINVARVEVIELADNDIE
jgi:hypothetical protein